LDVNIIKIGICGNKLLVASCSRRCLPSTIDYSFIPDYIIEKRHFENSKT
jgi:hypothetical protein